MNPFPLPLAYDDDAGDDVCDVIGTDAGVRRRAVSSR